MTDARTGKTLRIAANVAPIPKLITSGVRRAMDVQPPSSAGCHDYGGDVWACDVVPGLSYDLPVSSTIDTFSDPAIYCSNASPVFYWVKNPPRGITVTLLNASGASSCGSTWTGTVRVTLSAQAPWEDNGTPDFSFKLVYTACGSHAPADCTTGQNGFAQTGGTRYSFWTPYPAHGFPAIPERACGRCNGTTIGKPVDVASGEAWDEKTDLALSGPFGLSFTRFYGNQTAGSADLGGTNWLHTYAASLDASGLSNGNVTYYDNRGVPYYFTSVAKGTSAYDNLSGLSLALSSDGVTYTLTAFNSKTWTFDAVGNLSAMHDRLGNAQTVARDANNGGRIASVVDSAGRQLCFYYDGVSRIVAVAAWMSTAACPATAPATSVTTPVVSLGYNTGLNCSANSLCAVTEPDGNTWTYQYTAADTTYPYNLSEALDPLGNPEELNGFSANRLVHQETGLCSTSPCPETGGYVNITYPASGSSTVSITDGLGRASSITYDPNALLLTRISGPVCRCGGDQTRTYTYDASQRLTSQSDDGADGITKHNFTYAYGRDAGGRTYPGPTSIVENLDTAGTTRTTTYAYYPVGDPRQDLAQTTTEPSVDQPGLRMTTTDTYSTAGTLTQRATAGYVNGALTTYTRNATYDTRGRLLTQTGPRTDVTQRTTYAYFSETDPDAARAGQLQTVTDALGHVVQFSNYGGFSSFTPFGAAQSVTDANGVTTEYAYDTRGRLLTSTMLPVDEGDPTLITQNAYDAAGNRTEYVRPANNRTQYRYDSSNRVKKIMRTDAVAARHDEILVTYNAFDQPTTMVAQVCPAPATSCPSWVTTWSDSYAYSATTSDLTQVINADNTSKGYTYTPAGGLATYNDENHAAGSNYSAAYDVAGRRLSETRVLAGAPGGVATTRYAYDLHDNVTSVTDPNGNVTAYRYDDFDRMLKETSPVSGVTTFAYDADDDLTLTANANGATSTYTYDALDRALTEADTKGSATANEAWTYDDATIGHFGIGRLSTMTDPSGSTAYTYDRLGKLQVENHNIGGSVFTYGYGYDVNGNRSTVTYPDGTIVSYTFDYADRPYSASQTNPSGGGTLSAGRRVRTLARLRALGLPAPNHPAKSEMAVRPFGVVRTVPLSPHSRSATPMRGEPAAGSHALPGTAQAAGRTTRGIRPDSSLVASATYAAFGPLTSLTFGNGTTQTILYNQRYLPQENKLVAGGRAVADHVYSEDSTGNVTAISDALDAGYTRTFSYDDVNRLTTANSGTKLWGTATGNGYTYDAMGNVQTLRLGATHSDTFNYRAGGAGSSGLPQIASVVENGTTRPVTYDANGSELTDGVNTFGYGARELLGANLPNVPAYSYDGFRQRVQSQLQDGTQRDSFFDPQHHLLAESALSVGTPPTTVAYDYVWFGDRAVAQLDTNGTHWIYGDLLGTPLLQTEANTAVSWQAEHEPYGAVWALRSGDVHQPLRAPGQASEQFDTGANGLSALSYNNARWYRPSWGRYTQSDPFGIVSSPRLFGLRHAHKFSHMGVVRGAMDPAASDLFSYAQDDPAAFYDPSGLFAFWGNYCGPHHTNGKNISELSLRPNQIGPAASGVPYVDTLDQCCGVHDACYSSCSRQPCDFNGCKNGCDGDLHDCSTYVGVDFGSHTPWQNLDELAHGFGIWVVFGASPTLRDLGIWPW